MKHAFRPSRVGAALLLLAFVVGALVSSSRVPTSEAQSATLSATPDHFVVQITRTTIPFIPTPTPSPTATPTPSPTATPAPGSPINLNSHAVAISDDGRYVVIESDGDIATLPPGQNENEKSPHNRDGNQEIFLFDYAQRRIFQLTDTRHALKDAAGSPITASNIDVVVTNHHATISRDGRFVVFSSNAYSDSAPGLTPKSFNGQSHATALKADGNSEVFVYPIPEAPAADLSAGEEVPFFNLASGTPTRVTSTPATALTRPGTAGASPFFADDNRVGDVNDNGSYVTFVTEAKSGLTGVANADGNPEVIIYNRLTGTFTQVTNTSDVDPTFGPFISNDNPSLSGGSGTVRVAFYSNADINTDEAEADRRNGEVYIATYNGAGLAQQTCRSATVTGPCAVTKTPPERRLGFAGTPVNIFNPGRRISRDGNYLLFESSAVFNRDGTLNGSLANTYGVYLYNVGANQFALVGNRVPDTENSDIPNRHPTFTGDNTRVVWSSTINYRADGTVAAAGSNEGLNPQRGTRIFTATIAQLDAATPVYQFSRLTGQGPLSTLRALPSNTVRRIAFSLFGTFNFGEGNSDALSEALYLVVPEVTSETPAASPTPAATPADVQFFSGATLRPVVAASPAPSPSPGEAVTSLAAGELAVVRSATLTLAPTPRQVPDGAAHEFNRRPALPVELNGVSVSVFGAAAGLYSVGPNQINFVIPPGVQTNSTAALPVVINNNGAVIRTSLLITAAAPDIFSSTNGPQGRAAVVNVTNACVSPPPEPFNLFTPRPVGNVCTVSETELAATRLKIILTGVRGATTSQVTVRIRDTDITGANIISVSPTNTPGFDEIVVQLPDNTALIGADSPIIVTVASASSRPAATAPLVTIAARGQ